LVSCCLDASAGGSYSGKKLAAQFKYASADQQQPGLTGAQEFSYKVVFGNSILQENIPQMTATGYTWRVIQQETNYQFKFKFLS